MPLRILNGESGAIARGVEEREEECFSATRAGAAPSEIRVVGREKRGAGVNDSDGN